MTGIKNLYVAKLVDLETEKLIEKKCFTNYNKAKRWCQGRGRNIVVIVEKEGKEIKRWIGYEKRKTGV